jgi:cobalt-zinc-cadmium efflux system membrane fusion protein
MFLRNKRFFYVTPLVLAASLVTFLSLSSAGEPATKASPTLIDKDTISITDKQAMLVKIETAHAYEFVQQRRAIGTVEFNQEKTVQVFSQYQGRIKQVFVTAGDNVILNQPLFSIESPDFLQATSTLISTAGVRILANKALERVKKMAGIQASSQRDLDQALSDQQSAEANYRSARNAMRIFGKNDSEIDAIISSKQVNAEMVVLSPIAGRVISRNAQPGLLVQPGSAPAPIAVADQTTMWIVANVPETELAFIREGQELIATVNALPGTTYQGKIVNIGATVDSATRRVAVRAEISNIDKVLRAQMLAGYVIKTGASEKSIAIPTESIVREGDGTITTFVTSDDRTFKRRSITTGLTQNNRVQVLSGLTAGEKIASDGALFLSNALALQSR